MTDIERVLPAANQLGEGPLWSAQEQALYWVDIEGDCFHCFYPETGKQDSFQVGQPIGCLAFRASGGLVLALRDGLAFWDMKTRSFEIIASPEADRENARFNDGRVDSQGRLWAGTLGEDSNSCLYRFDPDGMVHEMETGITISNGIGWSPDDRTLYYTDSPLRVIYAYDFDPPSGEVSNRRDFVRIDCRQGRICVECPLGWLASNPLRPGWASGTGHPTSCSAPHQLHLWWARLNPALHHICLDRFG